MGLTAKAALIQEIKRLLQPQDRCVNCAARIVVYARGDDDKPYAAYSYLKVYGGIYDRVTKRYVRDEQGRLVLPPPGEVKEIDCHPGQVRFLTVRRKKFRRIVMVGATGSGKTEAMVRRRWLLCLENPNTKRGLTAPTNSQRRTVWDKFLEFGKARGWVDEDGASESKKQIRTVNGCTVDVLATQRQSKDKGHPTQGKDWDDCGADESSSMDDSAHVDLWDRGRNSPSYGVDEATSLDDYPSFLMRLESYKAQPEHYCIIKCFGDDNPWTPRAFLEAKIAEYGGRDSRLAKRRIFLEDIPPDRLVYPRFVLATHVKRVPKEAKDITERVTREVLGTSYQYVMGQDFGVLTTVTVVLKCFELPGKRRAWWVLDEITSRNEYSDRHARLIKSRYPDPEDYVVIADPHFNTREGSDKSDYTMFRNEGLTIMRAAGDTAVAKKHITVKHRIAMVNGLFDDGKAQPSLYLDADGDMRPKCRELAKAFLSLQYNDQGKPEPERKDHYDMTHWPDALGYGLYRFERFRGGDVEVLKSKPWYAEGTA